MSAGLPQKLGGEFWLSLPFIPVSLFFAYLGFASGSGRNLVGSLVVAAIFIWRVYSQVQKVRFARLLSQNPEIQRIYESSDR